MDNNISDKIPEGYIKNRKRAVYLFLSVQYILALYSIILKFRLIGSNMGMLPYLAYTSILAANELSLINLERRKWHYKGIIMYNCNEIKVFSKGDWIVLIIPIFITVLINPLLIALYLGIIIPSYLAIKNYHRPFDLKYDANGRYYAPLESVQKQRRYRK